MSNLRRHLSYANVVSTLALCFAIGGAGALAASQLAPSSVGERQLRPGAVTAKKLRKNAVTAPKITPLAVKEGKLSNGAVVAEKLANGAVTSPKLGAAVVTREKIGDDAVSGAKVDESSLSRVPSAAQAEFATEAASANPAAFAAVSQEGDVDSALSKGVGPGDVSQGLEAGIYCVRVPGFSPRGAQATPRYNGSGSVDVFVTLGGTASCAVPAVEVQTFSSGSRIKEPFYIVLYR